MIWSRRIALLRFWLSQNTAALGIPLAVAVIALLGLCAWLLRPSAATGPTEFVEGRVTVEVPPPDQQDYNMAMVVVETVDGERTTMPVPLTLTCRAGDRAIVAITPSGRRQTRRLVRCTSNQKSDDGPRQAG